MFVVFICCIFYGEVSWFLAKFVLRCICCFRAYFSVRLSPVVTEMSLIIVLNLLPNSLVLGTVHCSKTHTGWISDPWIGLCISIIWRAWEDLENFKQFLFNMQSGSVKYNWSGRKYILWPEYEFMLYNLRWKFLESLHQTRSELGERKHK